MKFQRYNVTTSRQCALCLRMCRYLNSEMKPLYWGVGEDGASARSVHDEVGRGVWRGRYGGIQEHCGTGSSVGRVMSGEGHLHTSVWFFESCIRMTATNMVSPSVVLHVEIA
jgi:hypothetical protein